MAGELSGAAEPKMTMEWTMKLGQKPVRRWALRAGGAVLLVWLSACSTTRLDAPAPVEDRRPGSSAAAAASAASGSAGLKGDSAQGVSETRVAPVDLGAQGSAGSSAADAQARAQRVVYFDFDSFSVKEEYRGVVEANARYLNADRKRRMLVEGHTDDRGGREYNLALGQKRAESVVRAMMLLGPKEVQLEAVSYGEERPAVAGNGEAAWAKNRRAELKDNP